MLPGERRRFPAARKIGKALAVFVCIAIAIPVGIGLVLGMSSGKVLSLISSTALLQAGAPPVGLILGFATPLILVVMACFAVGVTYAIYEACESLALASARVRTWIGKMEKKTQEYPQIQRFGPLSCVLIAWIPGIGLYGTPVIAWILRWRRLPAIAFTVTGFLIACIFVLFFARYIAFFLSLFLVLGAIAAVLFAVTSMLSLAFTFTIPEVLGTLRDCRLVALSLAANFILVPLVAWLIVRYAGLTGGLSAGLAILATAAGATFLLRYTKTVKGNASVVGGLMVLPTVVTVFFMPLALPFLLPGTAPGQIGIAATLLILILLPLGIGLLARSRYQEATTRHAPLLSRISAVAFGAVLAGFLGGNLGRFLAVALGTLAIPAILAFLLAGLLAGYFPGGPDSATRRTLAVGTAQRNLAAATVVATFLFWDPVAVISSVLSGAGSSTGPDPDTIIMVALAGLVVTILFMLPGKWLAKKKPE